MLEQADHSFSYHYQTGFYNADGEWIDKALPKKHQAEVERTLQHFYKLISGKLTQLECTLSPAKQVTAELSVTAA
nr:Crl family RNA polymerase assembly factor [Aeromonas caviae]